MFRKLMIAAAVAAVSALSQASTLYWQVAPQDTPFTSAQLWATDGTTAEMLAEFDATDYNESTGKGTYLAPVISDLGNYGDSTYSFYVELVTYSQDGKTVESTTSNNKDYPWSYNELVSKGYVSTGAIATPSVYASGAALDGGSVPEPTSGVMLLMGASLLALRRRRG